MERAGQGYEFWCSCGTTQRCAAAGWLAAHRIARRLAAGGLLHCKPSGSTWVCVAQRTSTDTAACCIQQTAASCASHLALGLARLRALRLHLVNNVHALQHAPKHHVAAVLQVKINVQQWSKYCTASLSFMPSSTRPNTTWRPSCRANKGTGGTIEIVPAMPSSAQPKTGRNGCGSGGSSGCIGGVPSCSGSGRSCSYHDKKMGAPARAS